MPNMLCRVPGNLFSLILSILLAAALATPSTAQQMGRVEGTVVQAGNGEPVGGVRVAVVGTNIATLTGTDGSFVLQRVPAGQHTLLFRWLGFQEHQETVTVTAGATQRLDVRLQPQPMMLGDVIVSTASRTAERVVEAPAAIAVVDPITLRDQAVTGQAPRALHRIPGVDVVQSGMNDFNVNARGFNSSLNRRILVMQDGRDLAIAFLGSQEWNAMSLPLDHMSRMEMVRGPGSALYGANAFSGVINITTPPARDVIGTKVTLAGGELSTYRGDLRHAGVSPDGRIGYRFNFGYNRSNSWSRSRTAVDGSDALAEYCPASATATLNCDQVADTSLVVGVPSCQTILVDCLSVELRPLSGQTIDPTTGVASGDIDELQNIYGSARFDVYQDNGSMFTVEGGASRVENELFVTGIGRVQVTKALRPWSRIAWASENYNIFGWYSGRESLEPQFSLGTGAPLEESSAIFHFEGQYNRSFADDKARVVVGGSYRNYNVDTEETLMAALNDDRSDNYFSGYGQIEIRPVPQLRLVGAARVDDGTLFNTQFSPKAAVVYSPTEDHSFRVSVNRAFQTPNYSEFFLQVQAGATPQPAQLEGGLLQYFAALQDPSVVGPPLAGVMATLGLPSTLPWNFAAQTPVMALGNDSLDVEKVLGWEMGYKGNLADNAYVSIDLYLNKLKNFVTDLLFGVNRRQFPEFLLSAGTSIPTQLGLIDQILAGAGLPADHPLRANNAALAAGYTALAASPFTDLAGVGRVIYLSYAQAGEVEEKGIEIGFGYGFTPEFRVDATYTYFDFDIEDPGRAAAGQSIVPNTPRHKGSIAFTYTGFQGFDASLSAKFVEKHEWNAGVFAGRIPANQMVDVNLGYRINNNLRPFAAVSNLLDKRRFQLYGGSVIGRRILVGATATF
ncbi:MAG: TonB-dependent receptor [Gemmatimonadetes bacterium]|nr:TonB-dependent receptor [Gemmatimonadota bacterium]